MDKQTFLDRIAEVCKNTPIDISKLTNYTEIEDELLYKGWFYIENPDPDLGYLISYADTINVYNDSCYMTSFFIENTESPYCTPNPPINSVCFVFYELYEDGSSTTVSEIPDEFAESALIDLENTLFPKGINYTQIALGITLAAVAAYGLHKMDVI